MIKEPLAGPEFDYIIDSWAWRIKRAGYNQITFSKKIKRDQSNLGRWMRRKVRITIKNLLRIENTLRKIEGVELLAV